MGEGGTVLQGRDHWDGEGGRLSGGWGAGVGANGNMSEGGIE